MISVRNFLSKVPSAIILLGGIICDRIIIAVKEEDDKYSCISVALRFKIVSSVSFIVICPINLPALCPYCLVILLVVSFIIAPFLGVGLTGNPHNQMNKNNEPSKIVLIKSLLFV